LIRPGRGIGRLSPWTVIALLGCATLALVDFWRDQSPGAWPLVQGTTPNLVAVPTLVFGFLMLRFPERQLYTPENAARQSRLFWRLLAVATAVTVAWEFSQLTGKLVFDPLDLVATALGAIATVALFLGLSRVSFLQPGQDRP
jgi:hypothetical protein